jgi:hypothetical protein
MSVMVAGGLVTGIRMRVTDRIASPASRLLSMKIKFALNLSKLGDNLGVGTHFETLVADKNLKNAKCDQLKSEKRAAGFNALPN